MSKNLYVYEIINWEPINTNSMNLLSKVNIKPDIKLLELFKIAPLYNILCKISDTNSVYDNKVIYGKIDQSLHDNTYYITLDHVWFNYPDKNGKIEFLANTVYQTIDYIENKGSPEISTSSKPIPSLNLIIEIKSKWILKKQGEEIIKAKEKATIASGFNYYAIIEKDYSNLNF